jgi:glycosyltransferase involved in cell wall biosynthesis
MISIIVPLFNEMENVEELKRRLLNAAPAWQESFEVVLIDDGSFDGTSNWCRRVCEDDARFRLIELSRNFGHQAAICAGLDHAKGDSVVILHSDLQDPPEMILHLLEKLREGYDVAYGIRKKRKESIIRRAVYSLSYRLWALLLTDIHVPVNAGDFCAMNKKVVRAMGNLPEKMRFLRGLRRWVGFRQVGVEYSRDARHLGSPKVSWSDLSQLALGATLDFSNKPLYLLFLGIVPLIAGCLLLVMFLNGYFVTGNWAKWTSPENIGPLILIFVLIMTGIQLIGLAIVAVYVGRILQESKSRPTYIVREMIGFE